MMQDNMNTKIKNKQWRILFRDCDLQIADHVEWSLSHWNEPDHMNCTPRIQQYSTVGESLR